MKETLLAYYGIDADTYHMKWHHTKKKPEETYTDMFQRLVIIATNWTKKATTKEQQFNIFTMEKGLTLMPDRISTWVRDKKLTTPMDAAQLADDYIRHRGQTTERGASTVIRQPLGEGPKPFSKDSRPKP